jgi:hypothetical protein
MSDHDCCHQTLAAFLAGDLDPTTARQWDAHLLACEQCWRAVREDRAGHHTARMLRQPAPPGLADRVTFAVELAAAGQATHPVPPSASAPRQPRRGAAMWLRCPRLAGTVTLTAALAVTLTVFLLPRAHQASRLPAGVALVARYALALPAPSPDARPEPGRRGVPVPVGRPVTVTADGQNIVLRTWRLDGVEAVVAVSRRPFPMPARARGIPGMGMAWTKRAGTLSLYCLNGRTSELVAAPVPVAQLATLAARLPPA